MAVGQGVLQDRAAAVVFQWGLLMLSPGNCYQQSPSARRQAHHRLEPCYLRQVALQTRYLLREARARPQPVCGVHLPHLAAQVAAQAHQAAARLALLMGMVAGAGIALLRAGVELAAEMAAMRIQQAAARPGKAMGLLPMLAERELAGLLNLLLVVLVWRAKGRQQPFKLLRDHRLKVHTSDF